MAAWHKAIRPAAPVFSKEQAGSNLQKSCPV